MFWNRFTDQDAADPALARTKDGVLHLAWRTGTKLFHGTLLGPPVLVGDWEAVMAPSLFAASDGSLTVVAAAKAGLQTAKSKDGGGTWEVTTSAAPHGVFAVAGDKEGKPFVTAAADVGGKADRVAVAMDAESFEGWAVWHEADGLFAKAVKPPTGAPQAAPGGGRLIPAQRIALSPRIGAPGVYLAYCGGTPALPEVKIWNTRGGEALTVAKAPGVRNPWLAPAPEGRFWILWLNRDGTISAVRTSKGIIKLSKPYVIAPPAAVRSLLADGAAGPLDLVVNASYTRILPELEVTASKDGVRVTDLGDPVEGALVETEGKSLRTDVKGLAAHPIAEGTTPVARVTHALYAPARLGAAAPGPRAK